MGERDNPAAPPSVPSPRRPVRYHLGRLGRLIRKELNEILRDRRTILTLVLMPLLLYPLLSMAFRQFALAGLKGEPVAEYRIAAPNTRGGGFISHYLLVEGGAAALAHEVAVIDAVARTIGVAGTPARAAPLAAAAAVLVWQTGDAAPAPLPARDDPARPGARLHVTTFPVPDVAKAVLAGEADVGIRFRHRPAPRPGEALDWEVFYLDQSAHGRAAAAYVERQCAAANARFLGRVLHLEGVAQRAVPVRVFRVPLGEVQAGGQLSLPALVPLILILMTITGAVYPAIDLTAGERERGTLEILVAAPVPRLALLFAKYVSVVTVAVLTAVVNLVMMIGTVELSGLGPQVFGGGLTALLVLELFGLLLLFAAFFSAVLLALTSFARSFKEAQAYLIPLMLVSLAPGLIGMMPGLELGGLYSVTPLLNIVLLARDLLGGKAVEPALAVVVVASTLAYALAAIAGAARIFGAEGVLYSEQGNWSDLLRRPARPRPTVTLTAALGCLAVSFPAYFVLSSLLSQAPLDEQQWLQVLAPLLLFALLPLLVAAWGRVRLASAFEVRGASWVAYPAATVLGLALVPLVYELLFGLRAAGLTFIGREQEEQVRRQIGAWRALSPLLLAAGSAAVGVLEELFFRGYLFSALRAVGGATLTILGSGLLFGLFHAPQAFDRLLPSTLLGVVLGWVCWRTGSVLPGMLLHAAYNAFSILLVYYNEGSGAEGAGLPLTWLCAGILGAAAGAAPILWGTRPALPGAREAEAEPQQ